MPTLALREPIRRRSLLACIAGLSAATGLTQACRAISFQAPWTSRRISHIGYGSYGPCEAYEQVYIDPFLDGLRELGYVEGESIAIDWRFTSGDDNQEFRRVARELVEQDPDVIVEGPSVGIGQEVKQATSRIPVGATILMPVESGMVSSLGHPGGNVTGPPATWPGCSRDAYLRSG